MDSRYSMTKCRNVCCTHKAIGVGMELPYKEFTEMNKLQDSHIFKISNVQQS